MTKYQRQYTKFYEGMSSDDYLGSKAQVLDTKGLKINEDYQYVQLEDKAEKANYTSENPNVIYEVDNHTFVGCDEGLIYPINSDVERHQILNNPDVKLIFKLGGYLYFVSHRATGFPAVLSRVSLNNLGTFTGFEDNYLPGGMTLPNPDREKYAVIEVGPTVYLGIGSNLVALEGIGTDPIMSTYDFLTSAVAGFSNTQGTLKIYQTDGKVLVWDRVDTLPNTIIDYDVPSRNVKANANIDYVIGGFNVDQTEMFLASGFSRENLVNTVYSNVLEENKFSILANSDQCSMTYKQNNLYFGVRKEGLIANVMSYGSKIRGLKNAFNVPYYKSSLGNEYQRIYCVYGRDNYLYIGYSDGTNKGVDRINLALMNQDKVDEGYIILMTDIGTGRFARKTPVSCELEIRDIDGTTQVDIYIKLDSGNFILAKSITDSNKEEDGYYKVNLPGDKYKQVTFKIVLKSLFEGDYTPKFYGLNYIYDEQD